MDECPIMRRDAVADGAFEGPPGGALTRSVMRFPKIRLSLLTAVGACLFLAPAAQAGPVLASATDCDAQVLEQPFLPWADPASYVLAPGGTFESADSGWSLSGGAAVADGNESFNAHGAGEVASLALPAGSSATSRSMCIGVEHPTLRLFARRGGGGTLKVEVLFTDAQGTPRALPINYVTGTGAWQPTAAMPIFVNFAVPAGDKTAVAFRFTPQGGADWRIDDVYVDPYRSR
jgi:hypothetical protein